MIRALFQTESDDNHLKIISVQEAAQTIAEALNSENASRSRKWCVLGGRIPTVTAQEAFSLEQARKSVFTSSDNVNNHRFNKVVISVHPDEIIIDQLQGVDHSYSTDYGGMKSDGVYYSKRESCPMPKSKPELDRFIRRRKKQLTAHLSLQTQISRAKRGLIARIVGV